MATMAAAAAPIITAEENANSNATAMAPVALARPRLLVHIHAYSFQVWPELSESLHNITQPFDLIVTLPMDHAIEAREREQQRALIGREWPRAAVLLTENRGMDTCGFAEALHHVKRALTLDGAPVDVATPPYEYVLKLHSKTDPNWRRDMMRPLVGDRGAFDACMTILRDEPDVGALCVARWVHPLTPDHVCAVSAHALTAGTGVVLPSDRTTYFCGGTVFLARFAPFWRWAAVADLPAVICTAGVGREPLGGTAYVLEGMYGTLVYAAGMTLRGV